VNSEQWTWGVNIFLSRNHEKKKYFYIGPGFWLHSFTHTHTHTHTFIHIHTCTHTHALTHTHTLSLSVSSSLLRTHTHTHSYTFTHTHSLTHTLTHTHSALTDYANVILRVSFVSYSCRVVLLLRVTVKFYFCSMLILTTPKNISLVKVKLHHVAETKSPWIVNSELGGSVFRWTTLLWFYDASIRDEMRASRTTSLSSVSDNERGTKTVLGLV